MSSFKNPPLFDSVNKPYDRYVDEIRAWAFITDLEKEKQGIAIALSFPENDPSGIRDKVFNEIAVTTLKEENGVETLITYLNTLFSKDELCEVYERYTTFDRYSKTDEVKMDDFILAFERLYNRIKQKEMALPQVVLAFKLLEASKISHRDRQLVLTGVNYEQKETLFDQMKNSLRKFHGEQSLTSLESQACGTLTIKYEPKTESTFYTRKSQNFYQKYRGRGKEGAIHIIVNPIIEHMKISKMKIIMEI